MIRPLAIIAAALSFLTPTVMSQAPLEWQKVAPIPDIQGFAGSFGGVSGGALVFAGGAHIVGQKWGETFTKKWYDTVFVLEQPEGQWKAAGKLEAPLGYGVSITARDAVICIGGSNETGHVADVIELRYADGKVTVQRTLPKLPKPLANSCGALVGDKIFVAGGLETPTSTETLQNFWSLDLAAATPAWVEEEPWPGPARMLSVAGASASAFYLFSGTSLAPGPDGKPVRTYLRDAYRFTPGGEGWKKLDDLPRAAVAAPSPAIPRGGASFLIVSGDDGRNVDYQPVKEHPGFPMDVLIYDGVVSAWSTAGKAPVSLATAPVVEWRDIIVIPNGETRPRVRTPDVWTLPR